MASSRFVVQFSNSNVSSGNTQLLDFDTDPFGVIGLRYSTVPEITASILVYLATLSGGFGAGTKVDQVLYRAAGSPGSVPVPFPGPEFVAIAAAATTAGYTVPAWTTYNTSSGSGVLAPLGTSISVSELTATVGRTGRGRHFLPFVTQGVISAGGTVGTGTIALTESAALDILMGQASGTVPALIGIPWVLVGPASPASKEITNVKCQPIFSNLESRRR